MNDNGATEEGTDMGKPKYTEINVPVPLYPPHIPHGLIQDVSQVSTVTGR